MGDVPCGIWVTFKLIRVGLELAQTYFDQSPSFYLFIFLRNLHISLEGRRKKTANNQEQTLKTEKQGETQTKNRGDLRPKTAMPRLRHPVEELDQRKEQTRLARVERLTKNAVFFKGELYTVKAILRKRKMASSLNSL